VADALRDTAAGSSLVRPLTAALDLDGWAVIERLRVDISPHVRVPLVDLATNPPTG
jgi:LuxR family maltose regulon positive regulatory protein